MLSGAYPRGEQARACGVSEVHELKPIKCQIKGVWNSKDEHYHIREKHSICQFSYWVWLACFSENAKQLFLSQQEGPLLFEKYCNMTLE